MKVKSGRNAVSSAFIYAFCTAKSYLNLRRLLWLGSIALITAAFIIFDRESYLTLAASLVGVTSLIFCAKGQIERLRSQETAKIFIFSLHFYSLCDIMDINTLTY